MLYCCESMSDVNAVQNMLRVALTTAANHYDFYLKAANAVETPRVKALLLVLAETEGDLMDRIRLMMTTGILDAIEEVRKDSFSLEEPDPTPFGMDRTPFAKSNPDTDPRFFVCNRALEMEFKGFSFYNSIASRAKSEMMRRLYEYLAFIKSGQIHKIRKVCESF
jgi:rubrerythrin